MSRRYCLVLTGCLSLFLTCTFFLPAQAKGKKAVGVICTVNILNEFRAQDGTLQRTEAYQKTFPLTATAGFFEDYSTPSRFKEFSATMTQVGELSNVAIDWFADTSVFDSVQLNTTVTLPAGQNSTNSTSSQTFSSTPGHSTTSYTVTVLRN